MNIDGIVPQCSHVIENELCDQLTKSVGVAFKRVMPGFPIQYSSDRSVSEHSAPSILRRE